MRRNFILGRSRWAIGVPDLPKIASQLLELSLQLGYRLALLNDHLVQIGERLLQMHQNALDVGESLCGRFGHRESPIYKRASRAKFTAQASSSAAGAM